MEAFDSLFLFVFIVDGEIGQCQDKSNTVFLNHGESRIWGSIAVHNLARDPKSREELNLSDQQIEEIATFSEEEPKIKTLDRVEIAKQFLKKTLTSEQLLKLRQKNVIEKYGGPFGIWSDNELLMVFGFSTKEADHVYSEITIHTHSNMKNLDGLIVGVIEGLKLPSDDEAFLWEIFGPKLQVQDDQSNWQRIAILKGSQPSSLLRYWEPFPSLTLSDDQVSQLRSLRQKAFAVYDKRMSDADISQQIDLILSPRQRFAAVQFLNRNDLRSDLTLALDPSIARRLSITPSEVEAALHKLTKARSELRRYLTALELGQLRKTLNSTSEKPRTRFLSLIDGVWDDI